MLQWIDKVPYSIIVIVAIFLLVAPVTPMPHVAEKLIMLKNGTLTKPLDMFDLIYHLFPSILLILKIRRDVKR